MQVHFFFLQNVLSHFEINGSLPYDIVACGLTYTTQKTFTRKS